MTNFICQKSKYPFVSLCYIQNEKKLNTIICETSTKIEIFKSNRSFCNFYPNLPKTFFIHKMSKNKAHTWNEHLLNTWNGNLQGKSIILCFLPKLTQNFLSKIRKVKIHVWEKHFWNLVIECFCFLNPVWSKRKF